MLICDIGGGTSDFSLVRAHVQGRNVQFERTAIGEHLLLGGENLDLALARRVEQKLTTKLSLRQRHALRIVCSAAKERLLSEENIDRLPISILGGGRSVVGQMLSSDLSRDEVAELITNGFLPLTRPDEMPLRPRAGGLREIGLPYVTDPAITKHLAAFLKQAARTMGARENSRSHIEIRPQMARPDAVLFNGGFCIPAMVRERIIEAIAGWVGDGGALAPEDSQQRSHEQCRRNWRCLLRPREAGSRFARQGRQRLDLLHRNAFGAWHQGGLCTTFRHERGHDIAAAGSYILRADKPPGIVPSVQLDDSS